MRNTCDAFTQHACARFPRDSSSLLLDDALGRHAHVLEDLAGLAHVELTWEIRETRPPEQRRLHRREASLGCGAEPVGVDRKPPVTSCRSASNSESRARHGGGVASKEAAETRCRGGHRSRKRSGERGESHDGRLLLTASPLRHPGRDTTPRAHNCTLRLGAYCPAPFLSRASDLPASLGGFSNADADFSTMRTPWPESSHDFLAAQPSMVQDSQGLCPPDRRSCPGRTSGEAPSHPPLAPRVAPSK